MLLCLASSIVSFSFYSFTRIPQLSNGFAAYYTFSRMLVQGDDLSKAYDYQYFNSKASDYGFGDIKDMPNNMPTNAFVLTPFVWMKPLTAKITWGIFSIICLVLSIMLIFKIFEIEYKSNWGIISITITLLNYPVYQSIALGQIYLLLLFLFSLTLYFIKQNKKTGSSITLASAFIFKGYGFLIPVWFLVRKKLKEFLIFVVCVLIFFSASIPILGFNTWIAFYKIIPSDFLNNPNSSFTSYQTITGLFKHFFILNEWNPFPVIDLPNNLVSILVAAVNFIVILVFFRSIYKFKENSDFVLLSYAAVLGVSVITAPLAEEYHYVLFLPLIIGLGKLLFTSLQNYSFRNLKYYRITYAIAAAIVSLPIGYKSLQYSKFPVIIFAYPKLYAGIILLTLFLIITKNKEIESFLLTDKIK